ncbi:MAG: hypothetical protein ABI615_09025 [Chthoniobacterales bacterium]
MQARKVFLCRSGITHIWLIVGMLMITAMACMAANSLTSNAEERSTKLLDAISDNNFPEFVAGGTLDFLKMDKPEFDVMVRSLGPRLAAGYHLQYLTTKMDGDETTYSWKVKFNRPGNAMKLTLVLRGNKTSGFWLE